MNGLQGKKLTAEQAENLAGLQRGFIIEALNRGFEALVRVESGGAEGEECVATGTETAESQPPFEALVAEIRSEILAIRKKELTVNTADPLLGRYETIHEGPFTDREKLFLEFLLGLGFFDINNRIALKAALIMADSESGQAHFIQGHKDTLASLNMDGGDAANSFLAGMEPGAKAAKSIAAIMTEIFGENKVETYWNLLAQAVDSDDILKSLVNKGVSLRYTPERTEFLAMAQILHWLGFGGNGDVFKEIPALKNSPLLEHAIGFHGAGGESSFANRLKQLFGKMLVELRAKSTTHVVSLLQGNFPDETELKILDVGAGPTAAATLPITRGLAAPSRKVKIVATDVDGGNLQAQQDSQGPLYPFLDASVYADLNHPNLDFGADVYHSCSAALVLHQLDPKAIPNLLKALIRGAKESGIINLFTVGKSAPLQFMMIGANSVDREGSIPSNIFELVEPSQIAVNTRQGHYKVLLPLVEYNGDAPSTFEVGIYQTRLFQVVEVPETLLGELDKHRNDPGEITQLINTYFTAA